MFTVFFDHCRLDVGGRPGWPGMLDDTMRNDPRELEGQKEVDSTGK